jgi:hypothetical protein
MESSSKLPTPQVVFNNNLSRLFRFIKNKVPLLEPQIKQSVALYQDDRVSYAKQLIKLTEPHLDKLSSGDTVIFSTDYAKELFLLPFINFHLVQDDKLLQEHICKSIASLFVSANLFLVSKGKHIGRRQEHILQDIVDNFHIDSKIDDMINDEIKLSQKEKEKALEQIVGFVGNLMGDLNPSMKHLMSDIATKMGNKVWDGGNVMDLFTGSAMDDLKQDLNNMIDEKVKSGEVDIKELEEYITNAKPVQELIDHLPDELKEIYSTLVEPEKEDSDKRPSRN